MSSADLKLRLATLVRPRDQWTPVDEALYGVEDLYRVETGRAEQLRFEAFNVTNTPGLGDPVSNLESPDFGKVRSTITDPRQLQLALRLTF